MEVWDSGRLNGSTWGSTQIHIEGLSSRSPLLLYNKQTQSISTNYKEWRSRVVKVKAIGTDKTTGKAHHGRDAV